MSTPAPESALQARKVKRSSEGASYPSSKRSRSLAEATPAEIEADLVDWFDKRKLSQKPDDGWQDHQQIWDAVRAAEERIKQEGLSKWFTRLEGHDTEFCLTFAKGRLAREMSIRRKAANPPGLKFHKVKRLKLGNTDTDNFDAVFAQFTANQVEDETVARARREAERKEKADAAAAVARRAVDEAAREAQEEEIDELADDSDAEVHYALTAGIKPPTPVTTSNPPASALSPSASAVAPTPVPPPLNRVATIIPKPTAPPLAARTPPPPQPTTPSALPANPITDTTVLKSSSSVAHTAAPSRVPSPSPAPAGSLSPSRSTSHSPSPPPVHSRSPLPTVSPPPAPPPLSSPVPQQLAVAPTAAGSSRSVGEDGNTDRVPVDGPAGGSEEPVTAPARDRAFVPPPNDDAESDERTGRPSSPEIKVEEDTPLVEAVLPKEEPSEPAIVPVVEPNTPAPVGPKAASPTPPQPSLSPTLSNSGSSAFPLRRRFVIPQPKAAPTTSSTTASSAIVFGSGWKPRPSAQSILEAPKGAPASPVRGSVHERPRGTQDYQFLSSTSQAAAQGGAHADGQPQAVSAPRPASTPAQPSALTPIDVRPRILQSIDTAAVRTGGPSSAPTRIANSATTAQPTQTGQPQLIAHQWLTRMPPGYPRRWTYRGRDLKPGLVEALWQLVEHNGGAGPAAMAAVEAYGRSQGIHLWDASGKLINREVAGMFSEVIAQCQAARAAREEAERRTRLENGLSRSHPGQAKGQAQAQVQPWGRPDQAGQVYHSTQPQHHQLSKSTQSTPSGSPTVHSTLSQSHNGQSSAPSRPTVSSHQRAGSLPSAPLASSATPVSAPTVSQGGSDAMEQLRELLKPALGAMERLAVFAAQFQAWEAQVGAYAGLSAGGGEGQQGAARAAESGQRQVEVLTIDD